MTVNFLTAFLVGQFFSVVTTCTVHMSDMRNQCMFPKLKVIGKRLHFESCETIQNSALTVQKVLSECEFQQCCDFSAGTL